MRLTPFQIDIKLASLQIIQHLFHNLYMTLAQIFYIDKNFI